MTRGCLGGISFCFISHVARSTVWLSRTELWKCPGDPVPRDLELGRRSSRIFAGRTITREMWRCEFRKVCGAVAPGPMKPPEITCQRSPIASMSRFESFFRFRVSLTLKFILAMSLLILITSLAFGWFVLGSDGVLPRTDGRSRRWLAQSFGPLMEQAMAQSNQPLLAEDGGNLCPGRECGAVFFYGPGGETTGLCRKDRSWESPSLTHIFTRPIQSKDGSSRGPFASSFP